MAKYFIVVGKVLFIGIVHFCERDSSGAHEVRVPSRRKRVRKHEAAAAQV
jgi:hypothetical protein